MYDELRRAKEIGFDFVDELIDNIEILNLSGDEFSEFIRLANDERYLQQRGTARDPCYVRTGTVCF